MTDDLSEAGAASGYVFAAADVSVAAGVLDTVFADHPMSPGHWRSTEEAAAAAGIANPLLIVELAQISSIAIKLGSPESPDTELGLGLWFENVPPTADVVELWRGLASSMTAAAGIARVEDLLCKVRDGDVVAHAARSVEHYVKASAEVAEDVTRAEYLMRAWSLARKFRLQDAENAVLDATTQAVAAGPNLGSLLLLLGILAQRPNDATRLPGQHEFVEPYLENIVNTSDWGHTVATASGLRRSILKGLPDAEALRRITRATELAALRRIADAPGLAPLHRQSNLEDAAHYARAHGFKDELREVMRQLERITVEHLGLATIRHEGTTPRWLFDGLVHPFTAGSCWEAGLSHFLRNPQAATGDIEKCRDSVRGRAASLLSIFPTKKLGGRGLTRRTISDPQEKFDDDVAALAGGNAQYFGHAWAEGLQAIAARYGVPEEADVARLLVASFKCDFDGASVLAKALNHFWAGRFYEAALIAAPATEAAARRLLRELDEGVYQLEVGKNQGKYPSLATLIEELLKLDLDPDWGYYIDWLFVSIHGPNLRNELAHGLVSDIGPAYAALSLRAAAVLITASGTIDGEGRHIEMPFPTVRRGLTARISRGLLGVHLWLEQHVRRQR